VKNKFWRIAAIVGALAALMLGSASACDDDADVASENLSKAADNFEIVRRIVFYNGITGVYMLVIEGRCSIKDEGNQLEVTCKIGKDAYKKHFPRAVGQRHLLRRTDRQRERLRAGRRARRRTADRAARSASASPATSTRVRARSWWASSWTRTASRVRTAF
jgi:hypothetical protein